jgi:oligopeptide transport system substrate-binding protein
MLSKRSFACRHLRTVFLILSLLVLIVMPLQAGCRTSEIGIETGIGGGTLNLWDTGPITLDPAISSEMSSHSYIMQIFSGLVRLDENLIVQPDIAEKWQISDDGREYTFFLRKDVTFQDGRALTADDVKYSFERACDPATGSNTAATYLGDIVGASDKLSGKASEVSGVKVIDDYTIRITIDAPKSYILSKLSYPTAFVVDKKNVESGSDWWRKPNGSGPFKLVKWTPDDILVLEPNRSFYRKPSSIDRLEFHLLSGLPIALYETNEIDIAPVYESYIARVLDKKGPFYNELHIYPELSMYYLGFNTLKPPFDDVKIRQAFCHAIDKEKIIQGTLNGMYPSAYGIVPPGMPGYNENIKGLEFDVEKAKALIAESKYGSAQNIPPVTLTVSGWGGNIPGNLGAIVQELEQNLGVTINVRQIEPEVFLYSLRNEADELFMMGWVADYPDPQDFLEYLFRTDAEYNTGKYSNPAVDNLLKEADGEFDESKRMELYQQAEKIIVDDAACLPLWFGQNYVLVRPYVKNYTLNALGIPIFEQVSIEK